MLIQVDLGEWALKGILPGLAMSTRDRASSIQSLKQSLPELSDAAFDKAYRQFFIRAHLELLGYEARGEDWDDILDCFAAERERRYGRVASKL